MLAPLNTDDVIAELCVCIDEVLHGVSLDELRTVPGVRLLPNAGELVAAAQKKHLGALGAAVDVKTTERALASLLVVVGQLRDAQARL